MDVHHLKAGSVLKKLDTRKSGLSRKEAKKRLEEWGPNLLKEKKRETPLEIFSDQFKSFLILILIFAALFSLMIGNMLDFYAISAIIVLNALLGFIQEYRASKAIDALKKMISLKSLVVREGDDKEVPAKKLVPGDIIVIKAGDKIPADARLLEVANLKVDEASLTGESVPVSKQKASVKKDTPLAERRSMVYMNTLATNGRAKAVVVETGMNTEMGKIADMIQEVESEETPLTKDLEKVGKMLGIIILAISALVFGLGVLLAEVGMEEMLLTSIALAVSAIPEGLPAVVTVTLALGVKTMAKNKAIVRKLPAVETLGDTTIICSDKTGTITKNEMTVKEVFVNDQVYKVSGSGYKPEGFFFENNKKINPMDIKELKRLLEGAALCNDAVLDQKGDEWSVMGDPTEGALVVAAEKAGIGVEKLRKKVPRYDEVPFDSQRKTMTTHHTLKSGEKIAFVKGAPEKLIGLSKKVLEGEEKKMTPSKRYQLEQVSDKMEKQALRVLGVAYSKGKGEMVFLGLMGMIDPARPEISKALDVCRTAGISVKMITGDSLETAEAIAGEVGLPTENTMEGKELERVSPKDLDEVVRKTSLFARISPEQKLMIVKTLQEQGEVVAVTGDGVNDAPALRRADIGVGMGITGTDVSKEASDMVLQDDNFATIVKAIEQGRRIYDNIKNFIKFLLSANSSEISVIIATIVMGFPLPFIPLQILWINLVTDGLPALALGNERAAPGVMKRKPRKKKENILRNLLPVLLVVGLVSGFATMTAFLNGLSIGVEKARTLAFTTAIMFELFFVWNCRSSKPFYQVSPMKNKPLVAAVLVSVCLQLLAIYWAPLQMILQTTPLTINEWMKVLFFSSSGLLIMPHWFQERK